MLRMSLSVVGYVFMVLSVFAWLSYNNLFLASLGVFAGLLLLAVSKVVDYVHDLHTQSLGIPWSDSQLRKIKLKSRKLKVASSSLKIHAEVDAEYPILHLDGERYVRIKAFLNYLSQEERSYKLELPERDPIVLSCAIDYYPGVEMFELDDQVYIRLSCLTQAGLAVRFTGEALLVDN